MKLAATGVAAMACVGVLGTTSAFASTPSVDGQPSASGTKSGAPAPVPGAKASCEWGFAWQSKTCTSWSIPDGFAYRHVAVTTWGSGSQYCVIRPSANQKCDDFYDRDRFTTITAGEQQDIAVEPGDTIVQDRAPFTQTYHLQVFGLFTD